MTTTSTYALLADAASRAARYLHDLETRSVAPSPEAIAALSVLDRSLSAHGLTDAEVLDQLDSIVGPATMGMAGPRFFGFVIGGALPVTLAANTLATAWDQNAALYNITPGVAVVEQVALRWLLDVLQLPSGAQGAFVTGATVANLTALAAARHAVLMRAGWRVEADGLFGAPPVSVYVSAEAHPSVTKSLGVLGLGRARVTRIPVDPQGRMRVDALPAIEGPAIVCAQVGNVNTGSCDDVEALAHRLRGTGAWLHVDGAFGLWAAASPETAPLVPGLALADSWATDCHKWLNVPYDSGVAIVRDGHALQAAMAITAEYLPTDSPYRNPSDYAPELSRRARGVEVWAALAALGREGVADLVARCCRHARRFAQGLREAGFTVLNDVVLNQVLVSFGDADVTRRTIASLQHDGTCWAGITEWQGHVAMRISVINWATTDDDVERSLAAMLCAAGHSPDGQRPAGR